MFTPILTTKLHIPSTRPDLLTRSRLIEQLNQGAPRKLTLISASAGFGKTTLLSQWVASTEQPVAWLALDEGDNDRVRFMTYLILALQQVCETLGTGALAVLQAVSESDYEVLLCDLINEIAETEEHFTLVLDDYHVITEPHIHHWLVFMLENLPKPLHLMIATRSDPPWPLARLRAQRELIEIRSKDLRFTSAETTTLFKEVLALDLSAEDLHLLDERVEGWIAGLQMAALSVQGREQISEFIRAFTGSNRFILDFLMEEVLNQQPPDVQDFLYKTSFLNHFNADLCDAVLGRNSSHAVLEYLSAANLFLVPLDDEQYWFRYHHLFADLLLKRQMVSHPDELPELYQRASLWFENHDFLDEAVRYALAIKDTDRLVHLVESNVMPLIYQERLSAVERLLDNLPEPIKNSHPWLLIAQGWIQAYSGNLEVQSVFDKIQGISVELSNRETRAGLSKNQKNLLGHMYTILGFCEIHKMNYQAGIDYENQALELLAEHEYYTRAFSKAVLSTALKTVGKLDDAIAVQKGNIAENELVGNKLHIALSMIFLSILLLDKGHLNQAIAYAKKSEALVIEHTKGRSNPPILGQIYYWMGFIQVEQNHLDQAEKNALRSINILEKWERLSQLNIAYGLLAAVLRLKGRHEDAFLAIEKAIQTAQNYPHQRMQMEAFKADTELSVGEIKFAEEWIAKRGLSKEDEICWEEWYPYQVLARLLMVKERWDDALVVLEKLCSLMERVGANRCLLYTLVLKAGVHEALNEREQALAILDRSLRMAEPEGHLQPFLENGRSVKDLLQLMLPKDGPGIFSQELLKYHVQETTPQGNQPTIASARSPLLPEPLSERELEVLRFLNTHLSSTEIAQELHVSANTVRFHIKNIYSKLNVNRRADAVHQAKKLGIL